MVEETAETVTGLKYCVGDLAHFSSWPQRRPSTTSLNGGSVIGEQDGVATVSLPRDTAIAARCRMAVYPARGLPSGRTAMTRREVWEGLHLHDSKKTIHHSPRPIPSPELIPDSDPGPE